METIELDFDPNIKQSLAIDYWMDDDTVEVCFGGAKYGGKSFLGASLIFSDALTYPDTAYFIARKELNDLRKYTVPTIHKVFKRWGLDFEAYCNYNGQDSLFNLYNGSRVYMIECKRQPQDELFERFGSMEMTRGWIEEAGEVDGLAKDNLLLTIGRMNNAKYGLKRKLLLTCNPKKNFLYNEFYKPWKNNTLPKEKAFVQAYPDDNTHGDADYIKALYNSKDKVMRERLVKGNWEYDDDPNALMEYEAIASIFTNEHVERTGKLFITVDVARKGKDTTCIKIWDGLVCIKTIILKQKLVPEVAAVVKEQMNKYHVPAIRVVCDEDGVGGGVVDLLKCVGFIANSSPINPKNEEKYKSLKAQCSYKLAEYVSNFKIYEISEDEELKTQLIEDLEQVKRIDSTKENMNEVLSKEIIKRLIGRSPDQGDCYMMRMLFEVTGYGLKSL